MKNILVIGVGPHARRNHLPALAVGQESRLVGTVTGVDILGASDAVVTYDAEPGGRTLPVTLVEPFDSTRRTLRKPCATPWTPWCTAALSTPWWSRAHSGYHFFDIVPWLLAAGETSGKELDAVDVHATITRPGDVLAQLGVRDHERLFPGFAARNPYTETELRSATRPFGEVDAFISMAYKSGERTMTLGSVNLVHNGFSQRGSMTCAHASLYKGNGRVRHENHIIEQGPFQAIHFHSLQTLNDGATSADPYELGREGHIEVHVFRNDRFRPSWKKYAGFDFDALTLTSESDVVVPTQESSRRRAIQEFLEYLNGRRTREQMSSELTSHRRGSTLMMGAYLSMAQQWVGSSPVATLDFRTTRQPTSAPLHGRLEAAL